MKNSSSVAFAEGTRSHSGLPISSGAFDLRYCQLMSRMWDFKWNDQRPGIRSVITKLSGRFKSIWDIGAGDAHITPLFAARQIVIVEPNERLRKRGFEGSQSLAVTSKYSATARNCLQT